MLIPKPQHTTQHTHQRKRLVSDPATCAPLLLLPGFLCADTMLALKQGPAGKQQQQQQQQQQRQQQQQLSDIQGIQEAIWAVVTRAAGGANGDGRELLVSRDLVREVSFSFVVKCVCF
jgi:hypothetical protein